MLREQISEVRRKPVVPLPRSLRRDLQDDAPERLLVSGRLRLDKGFQMVCRRCHHPPSPPRSPEP